MLARIALTEIRQARKRVTGDAHKPVPRQAYILRQLKHRDEIEDLRDIYGAGLVTLSIYAPRAAREAAARRRLATKMTGRAKKWIEDRAEALIKKDEAEEGKPLGQRVGDAFPLGDFFVDATDRPSLNSSVRRYVELLFGNHFHTPSRDEFGMYQAAAAARRSSDLSRQIGAALVTEEGEVIALGCNDIPKAGGGLYWAEDNPDGRDFAYLGYDPAEQARRDILADVLGRLLDANILVSEFCRDQISETCDRLLQNELKGSPVASLIEFGRVLHAEMAAITDAAKRGVSTAGSTLYCTTFPCHMCARLIVAAGIRRVVFIEPYPKSKTGEMYADSIALDKLDHTKVSFQPFVGVSPLQYASLFQPEGKRKNEQTGEAIVWTTESPAPRVRRYQATHIQTENLVVSEIPRILEAKDLKLGTSESEVNREEEKENERPEESTR